MVVQSNFCNRDFLIDHKFSMGLSSGEFPHQSITSNFASWKSSSLFQMKDAGQYPIGIFLHHQEIPFSYPEWLFSQLHPCICTNSSYLNWHKWSYHWKNETSPEHLLDSFTSLLQWAGRNCSRFLVLINLLCFPGKKGLSSENSTFSVFLPSNILTIFCTFLAFLPASGGWRHTVLELL